MIGTAGVPNWSIIHKFAEIFFRADWITERPGGTPTDPQKSKIEPGFERFRTKFQNPQKLSQQKLKLRKLYLDKNYFPKMTNSSHDLVDSGESSPPASDLESYVESTEMTGG